MFDPEATRRSFNKDGFYLTGDIARQEGGLYYIEGRAAIDSELPISSPVSIYQKLDVEVDRGLTFGSNQVWWLQDLCFGCRRRSPQSSKSI
jgi:hypothetical protein